MDQIYSYQEADHKASNGNDIYLQYQLHENLMQGVNKVYVCSETETVLKKVLVYEKSDYDNLLTDWFTTNYYTPKLINVDVTKCCDTVKNTENFFDLVSCAGMTDRWVNCDQIYELCVPDCFPDAPVVDITTETEIITTDMISGII